MPSLPSLQFSLFYFLGFSYLQIYILLKITGFSGFVFELLSWVCLGFLNTFSLSFSSFSIDINLCLIYCRIKWFLLLSLLLWIFWQLGNYCVILWVFEDRSSLTVWCAYMDYEAMLWGDVNDYNTLNEFCYNYHP